MIIPRTSREAQRARVLLLFLFIIILIFVLPDSARRQMTMKIKMKRMSSRADALAPLATPYFTVSSSFVMILSTVMPSASPR